MWGIYCLPQARITHGVRPEILALAEIPYVKGVRARLLYNAGLRTPEAVAAVKADVIAAALAKGMLTSRYVAPL